MTGCAMPEYAVACVLCIFGMQPWVFFEIQLHLRAMVSYPVPVAVEQCIRRSSRQPKHCESVSRCNHQHQELWQPIFFFHGPLHRQ